VTFGTTTIELEDVRVAELGEDFAVVTLAVSTTELEDIEVVGRDTTDVADVTVVVTTTVLDDTVT
jgi:hypothetical protein